MPKENYQERKEAKLERLQALADKKRNQSKEEFEQAKKMADVIPFGQPILVGHHSEGRDRNFRKKIDNKFRKSFETSGIADHYDDRVKAMNTNTAISQDDPEAIQKIMLKIAKIEKQHAELKAKKPNPEAHLLANDSANMRSCYMTGYKAEIKRLQKRLISLKQLDQVQETKIENNGITLEINKSENRIMLFFPGKPSEEIRTKLKRNGFRWSPYNTAWQSYIHQWNLDFAKKEILGLGEAEKCN